MSRVFDVKVNFVSAPYVVSDLWDPPSRRIRYSFDRGDFSGIVVRNGKKRRDFRLDALKSWLAESGLDPVSLPVFCNRSTGSLSEGLTVQWWEWRRDGCFFMIPALIWVIGSEDLVKSWKRNLDLEILGI